MESLNIAYDVKEDRPMWKQRAIAVGLTLGLAVLVLAALGLMLFGADAADWLGAHVGLGYALVWAWKIVQWPVVVGFCVLLAGAAFLGGFFGKSGSGIWKGKGRG